MSFSNLNRSQLGDVCSCVNTFKFKIGSLLYPTAKDLLKTKILKYWN